MIKEIETGVIEKINQHRFFNRLKEIGYDSEILTKLFDCDKVDSSEKYYFNNHLRTIQKESNIKMTDIALYLEKYFSDYKKIINLLDSMSYNMLRKELIKTFNVSIQSDPFDGINS